MCRNVDLSWWWTTESRRSAEDSEWVTKDASPRYYLREVRLHLEVGSWHKLWGNLEVECLPRAFCSLGEQAIS